jgi:hypothetical protein
MALSLPSPVPNLRMAPLPTYAPVTVSVLPAAALSRLAVPLLCSAATL